MKRRSFISGAGAAFAAAALPTRRSFAAKTDVIVIGAGLSGLNAALILADQGANVTVLEGRKRVGGRIFSLDNVPGHSEAGANSMLAGYGRTLDISKQLGLDLFDTAPRGAFNKPDFYLQDTIVPRAEWAKSPINPFPDAAKALTPPDVIYAEVAKHYPLASFADWYKPESVKFDEPVQAFLERQGYGRAGIDLGYNLNQGYGTSAYTTSMLNWYFVQGWFALQRANGPEARRVNGGNSRLPEAMAAKLKGAVHLGKTVIGIRSGPDKAEVHCADGSVWKADRVVCSMPLPPMRYVRFDPELPPEMAKAIATIPQQKITQVHLVAKQPFWDHDGLNADMWTDTVAGQVMASRFGKDDHEVTSLTAWARGFQAEKLDELDEADAKRLVVSEIERIRPAARGKIEAAAMKSWQHDPFSGGDWVVWAPGQPTEFAALLSTPHERTHFCGEHTGLVNRGMEAAMESGERAALEVLSLG
jgi:monoamine oxidase